ncbi:MAG: IPT/TIG domain-containing protein [Xanthobacteraceae bacterium]|nr:IPT/TIG domain-containing protein [Xanthobacteraceae bacterium]
MGFGQSRLRLIFAVAAVLVSFVGGAHATSTPAVSSISPSSGTTDGGTSVTITGSGFTGATTVTIDGVAVSGFSVINDGQINATTAAYTAQPPSTGGVYVSNGTNSGSGSAFTYNEPAATVTSISVSSGPSSGGTQFNITGTHFNYTTSVTVGGVAVQSFTVNSSTSITVVTAADTGTVTPTVTGISPNHGGTGGGTGVTITGTNFARVADVVVTNASGSPSATSSADQFTYKGVTGVLIGGTAATNVFVIDSTTLTATSPPGIPGVTGVLVTNGAGNSGSSGDSLYTYTDGGPSINTIGPEFGLTSGGTTIIITGAHFVPGTKRDGSTATTVTIDGIPATNVSVNSTATLSATVPADSAGAKSVVVSTVAGTATGSYLYIAPATPIITSVSPNGGSIANGGTTAGGTQVKILGANFTGATSVTFGGVAVSGFTLVSSGEIDTTTPTHTAAGAVDVVVTVVVPNGGGTFTGTGTGAFTYVIPPPVVTAVGPTVGTTVGGTVVTITGQYFGGATAVKFGGAAASAVTVNSAGTSITATSPPGSGTVDVTVTTPSGTSTTSSADQFTYGTPPPVVSSVSPSGGTVAGGTSVVITGTNFTGATGVTFGGVAATIVNVSATSITATTPAHAVGAVNVSVTTPAGTGTGGNLYTYGASLPTVTSISPASGTTLGGTLVTITGTGFSGTPNVTINGIAAGNVIVTSPTTLTAVTPAGTGTNDPVIVTTSVGPSAAAAIYSYVAPGTPTVSAPTVSPGGVSPGSGPTSGGTLITITGTNLTGATAVVVGGNAATGVHVVSSTTITATTPPGTVGAKDVVVTTPGGTVTAAAAFQYVTAAPTVTAVNPNSGSALGGTAVTITGTNFTGATAVTFGGTAAATFTVVNATTISATTPAHGAGVVAVAVTTPGGGTGTGNNLFTFVSSSPPTVTAISPNHGDVGGGTSVTITGTNFTNATAVTIGGAAVQFKVVVNSTTITATTGAHAAGVADTVVTTTSGTSATSSADQFTYTSKPTVSGISPNSGPSAGGTTVTITGTNLTGATSVLFGSTPATIVSNGPNSITATAPPGSGTVNVTVTTIGGTSAVSTPDQFTYSGVPTVTLVTPNAGPIAGGTRVTITGTNFTGATAVKFGATSATSFSVNSATSITAVSPAGSGAVDVRVTTPGGTSATSLADMFSYAKAATSLTLTSTPNPSVVGQPVTFTAKITGNSPTGTVTFTYNNAVIGTATLVNGIATLKISSLPAGSDSISASYPGDANNAADPESIIQVVQNNSDSANLRQMQLTVMPIVSNLSGQAISGAIDSAIGVGLGGDPQLLTPNGGGFTYYFDGTTQPQASNESGEKLTSSTQALTTPGGGGNSRIDDDFKALGFADRGSVSPVVKTGPLPTQMPRDWLAWVDVRGAGFGHSGAANDLNGTQVNVLAGLTRRVLPGFVIGALGGYEKFDFSSQAYNGVLKGSGYTAGAYAGLRLGAVRFDAAGAWSDINAADTAGTASGNFTGTRLLASGGVTGTFNWAGFGFEPSARVYALWEHENAYTDSLGTLQGAHEFDTGRASSGMKVDYPFATGAGTLSPYVGLYGDYYFTKDNAPNPGLTTILLLQGGGVRATGGITAAFAGGPQLSVGGEYSRVGSDTQIWTFRARGHVPF